MEFPFSSGWTHFLAGGFLVGAGTLLVFLGTGIRAGASGFFTTSLSYVLRGARFTGRRVLGERRWRTVFSAGLVLGAALFTLLAGQGAFQTGVPTVRLLLGGILVGFGTRMSRGCTSGHGICGLSAGARSSLVAVPVFLAVAIATALLLRGLGVTP